MQLLQAAGGQDSYGGYGGQTASMGFTTFGGNMNHNQMSLSPTAFSQPFVGAFAAPYINDSIMSMNNVNTGLVLAQNSAQVQFAGYQDAMSSVLADTLEKSAVRQGYKGDMDWQVAANFLTASTFNSPLSSDFLGFLSATGLDQDAGVREGLLGAGVSQLSLNKYGLSSSLLHNRETQILEQNLRSAAENEDIGIGDALAAATSINDRRLGLNLSDKYTGFGDSTEFSKVTEDLKRAKELTGQSNVQTLSLLAEVYDNVIEGIIPQLGEFTDRMMILERQGVSVHEYSATVRNLRQKFRAMGIEDPNLVPDLVKDVLISRRSLSDRHWSAGDNDYNPKVAEARRYEQAELEIGSKEMAMMNVAMVLSNSRSAEDYDELVKQYRIDPESIKNPYVRDIIDTFESGDTDRIVQKSIDYRSGQAGTAVTRQIANEAPDPDLLNTKSWKKYTLGAQTSMSGPVNDLFEMKDAYAATDRYFALMALFQSTGKGDTLDPSWTKKGDFFTHKDGGPAVHEDELGSMGFFLKDFVPHMAQRKLKLGDQDYAVSNPEEWIGKHGTASNWQDRIHGEGVSTADQVYGIYMSAAMADLTDDNSDLLTSAEEFLESAKNADGGWKFSTEQIKAAKKSFYNRIISMLPENLRDSLEAPDSKADAMEVALGEFDRIRGLKNPTRKEQALVNEMDMFATRSRLRGGLIDRKDTGEDGSGGFGGFGGFSEATSEIERLLRLLVENTNKDDSIDVPKSEEVVGEVGGVK